MNLFVYGTLRPDLGHPMALRLQAAGHELGPAWIEGIMYDLGEFPGVMTSHTDFAGVHACRGTGAVHGLLIALADENPLWRELDDYEDVRGGEAAFALVSVSAWSCAAASWVDAVTYVYRGRVDDMPRIDHGDWAAYCRA
jgi:gamma-glutamylcyclotransferase (GGCT)/AIG2-like uncharacterized protein YtfP